MRLALAHVGRPVALWAPSTQDEAFLAAVADALTTAARADDDAAPPPLDEGDGDDADAAAGGGGALRVEKATLFSVDAARRRLLSHPVSGMPDWADEHAKAQMLSSSLGMGRPAQVRAAGALLGLLLRDSLLGPDQPLSGLAEGCAAGFLEMDAPTRRALGVFVAQRHPSHFVGVPKEGLSVFAALDSTVTPGGRRCLRSWLASPVANPTAIAGRHAAVAALLAAPDGAAELRAALREVGDAEMHLKRLTDLQPAGTDAAAAAKQWKGLLGSLSGLRQARAAEPAAVAASQSAAVRLGVRLSPSGAPHPPPPPGAHQPGGPGGGRPRGRRRAAAPVGGGDERGGPGLLGGPGGLRAGLWAGGLRRPAVPGGARRQR